MSTIKHHRLTLTGKYPSRHRSKIVLVDVEKKSVDVDQKDITSLRQPKKS